MLPVQTLRGGNAMRLIRLAAALACAALAALPALAQTYPQRPVKVLVAFPAGGTVDTLSRIVSQKLSEEWRQSVFVENRPGASGNLGAAAAAQAPADGYTLHFGAQTIAVNVTLAPYRGLDPLNDFEPVILAATAQDVLMVPLSSPFRTVREVIDHAKAHPGELNYASLGPGTSAHLATALFSELAGIKLQHVPYTSVSQAASDVIAGRIAVYLPTLGAHFGNIQGGRVRALAVSGEARNEQLPDVPTFKELGVPFVADTSWYAIYVPKGTSPEIVAAINAAVNRILQMPDVKERAVTLGFRLIGGPPERLTAFLKQDIARWAELAKTGALSAQ
jgi:tripartite-type tricarboxylate transporter receptor subunit TctC